MPKISSESFVLSLLVLHMATYTEARPRRRFCENFPFAPRCLGIAAKRDVSDRFDEPRDYNSHQSNLEAVQKLKRDGICTVPSEQGYYHLLRPGTWKILMGKNTKNGGTFYEEYDETWDMDNEKDKLLDSDIPSRILKKIIKRQSVNTDIISQERMPTAWYDYSEST